MNLRAATCLLVLALLPWAAGAQTARFAKANNTWTTPATWRTTACGAGGGAVGVPAAIDPVTICPGFTVVVNTSPTVASLNVQGTLSVGDNATARTLTVNGNVTNSGTLQYASAGGGAGHLLNITGAGTFTNTGTFTSAAVAGLKRLTVAGLLTNSNVFNLAGNAAVTVTANGGLTNSGTISYTTAQAHQLNVTGAFGNSGTFTSANVGAARALTVSGLITNSGTFRFHGSAAMTVNANGGITNTNTGVFDVNAASNNTHNLVIRGNVSNAGTFDLAPGLVTDRVNVTFNPNATLTVSGNGATSRFNCITVNGVNNVIGDMVDVTAQNFVLAALGCANSAVNGATAQGLALTDGTLRLSYAPLLPATVAPFGTAAYTIPANARFWLNSANVTVAHTANSNITLNGGVLRVDAGTFNASATAVNKQLILQSNAATLLEMNGGALNVGGRIVSSAAGALGTFTMTNGTITVGTFGNTNGSPFFLGTGTTLNQSGGTLVIQGAAGASDEYDVRTPIANATVTGGTLQLGNASTIAGQNFEINSVPPLWNLTVQNATADATLVANATVNGVLTLSSGDLVTGASTLTVGPSGSTAGGSATSHVVGNLRKQYDAASSFNFALGDGTSYTPVTVAFTTVTTPGLLTVRPTAGEHPDTTRQLSGVNGALSVNRYYTLANPTLTGFANVTLNYLAGDRDVGTTPANFVIGRGLGGCVNAGANRVCSGWTRPTLAGPPTGTQASATGIPVISTDPEVDFVVGEPGLARFSRERQFIYGRETY
jgi:hypothetical protein